ncbi:hypothetical protein M5K25_009184 [Dendrobium thyrsiflorum]|uniref:RING-type E3 ubiquitin transferase n=1 Tax=Dendrobium thyrsiflorum TaxID=117978 RepID=A0ABD0VBR3_DENTH
MEFLTNGRDEALKKVLEGLSALIYSAETIQHEEDNLHRYAGYMVHVRELIRKLQSQPATTNSVGLLLRMETEVNKAREVIDGYKSRSRLFRPFIYRSVVSKLNQSSKEIYAVLQLLPLTEFNTALNIKEAADAIIHGIESIQLKLSTNTNAILSSLDQYVSENSGNQQQTSPSLFMIARSKGIASNSVCPLPFQIQVQEQEGDRPHTYSCQQLPPSSFFLCPLTGEILEDPVSVSCDHSFEKQAIEDYFHAGQNLCPLCSKELSSSGKLELTSNSTLRNSILEWKRREERTNAERNAKKKFIDTAAKISLDNMEDTNRAIGDLHDLMIEIPSCISAATDSSCKLVPKLAELLKNDSSENISAVLKCLLLIARFSDENKEKIGKRGVIKCLFKHSMTKPNAVAVLLELSRNKVVAGKIEGIPYSSHILISFLDKPSSPVAEMARMVLENLSIDINSTVMMAKFGYFTPFMVQFNSQDISDEIRAYMAEELAQIQLTDTYARNLENEQLIVHLTEMLSCHYPSGKMASLKCIKQFIAFNEPRTCFLKNECAIPALLCLVTSKTVEEELKQKALEILMSLIQTTQPSHPGLQTLFSSNGIQDIINQITTSAPEDQISLLHLLLVMAQNSAAAGEWIVSDHNAMSFFFSAIILDQNKQVKVNALRLISYFAGNHHIVFPSSPSKESIVSSLIALLTENRIDEELYADAASILIHLPADDKRINELLLSSAVLKSIHALITHSNISHLLLENALGVLLHCVKQSQSNSKFQKKVSNLLRTDLIETLSTGSILAKQRVAMILSHLSRCTMDSSLEPSSSQSSHFSRLRLVNIRRSVKEGDGCPVHKSSCSQQRSICLVMDKAVKPLIEMVNTMEFCLTEAALMALDTLFDPGCNFIGAATTIIESHGATPMLEVLERGELNAKEKALELFSKICGHSGITEMELDRFKGLLLNIVRKDDHLKNKAENFLKDLV